MSWNPIPAAFTPVHWATLASTARASLTSLSGLTVQADGEISFHAAQVLWPDSVPELEYEETLHKASGILRAAR